MFSGVSRLVPRRPRILGRTKFLIQFIWSPPHALGDLAYQGMHGFHGSRRRSAGRVESGLHGIDQRRAYHDAVSAFGNAARLLGCLDAKTHGDRQLRMTLETDDILL